MKSEYSKRSPQCYTVRDLNISINSIAKGKSPKEVVSCFYGSRYDKETYQIMQDLLKEKYPDLYKDSNEVVDLPDDFPKCFHSNSITFIKNLVIIYLYYWIFRSCLLKFM